MAVVVRTAAWHTYTQIFEEIVNPGVVANDKRPAASSQRHTQQDLRLQFHAQLLVLYSGGEVAVTNGITATAGW